MFHFVVFLFFQPFEMTMTTTMTAKELGQLQRRMNELLQSGKMDEFRLLLDQNADLMQTTREKGIITMVLRFAILHNDDARIASVFDRLSMKRDYFALMLYNPTPEYCAHLFTRYIDAALLDSNDIRFMIENRLTFLFRHLDGKFLHDSQSACDKGELVGDDEPCLSRYALQGCEHYIQAIVNVMDQNPKNETKQHVSVLQKLKEMNANPSSCYDTIVDGANVLLSRNGIPRINDLKTMLQIARQNGCRPLVVIHNSRTDKHNPKYVTDIHNILQEVPHIITPTGMNDDLFILLAYLMRIQKDPPCPRPRPRQQNDRRICIITRDTYTDHMDKFKRAENDDFGKYLANDLISFLNSHGKLDLSSPMTQDVSHCIQIVEPYAYIPFTAPNSHYHQRFRKIQM